MTLLSAQQQTGLKMHAQARETQNKMENKDYFEQRLNLCMDLCRDKRFDDLTKGRGIIKNLISNYRKITGHSAILANITEYFCITQNLTN